jgi:hypothetical protein
MVNDTVASSLGGPTLTWIAYVPGCYDAQPEAKFPLLLLFHAAERDACQWVALGFPETADGLIAQGEIAP